VHLGLGFSIESNLEFSPTTIMKGFFTVVRVVADITRCTHVTMSMEHSRLADQEQYWTHSSKNRNHNVVSLIAMKHKFEMEKQSGLNCKGTNGDLTHPLDHPYTIDGGVGEEAMCVFHHFLEQMSVGSRARGAGTTECRMELPQRRCSTRLRSCTLMKKAQDILPPPMTAIALPLTSLGRGKGVHPQSLIFHCLRHCHVGSWL